jgi:glycosyltransferase involved in cell wall biosynthesis
VRLLLVNYEYPPLGGGAGNATACIARALTQQAHEVSVVTGAFGDLRGTQQESASLRVIRLATRRARVDRSNYAEMLSFVLAAACALPRIARETRADGMIVFFSLPCGPLGWLIRRLAGVPYVISLRGGDVPGAEARVGVMHRLLAPLRRAVLRRATAVVANSRGLARLSEQADPVPVEVIPNGVDTVFFCPAPEKAADPGEVRFLFAGRFQSQKNLFVLLDQFAVTARRSSRSLRLTLIGDGPQRAELEAHAQGLGIANLVEWCGWLDKPGLRDAYQCAQVFLNPSLYEGMPNTVLEAMACGLPVIASRVIGNDEVVEHDATGLLFDLDRPDDLAAAMSELANAPARRASMGKLARQRACDNYSWDTTAARYAQLLVRQ